MPSFASDVEVTCVWADCERLCTAGADIFRPKANWKPNTRIRKTTISHLVAVMETVTVILYAIEPNREFVCEVFESLLLSHFLKQAHALSLWGRSPPVCVSAMLVCSVWLYVEGLNSKPPPWSSWLRAKGGCRFPQETPLQVVCEQWGEKFMTALLFSVLGCPMELFDFTDAATDFLPGCLTQ